MVLTRVARRGSRHFIRALLSSAPLPGAVARCQTPRPDPRRSAPTRSTWNLGFTGVRPGKCREANKDAGISIEDMAEGCAPRGGHREVRREQATERAPTYPPRPAARL